MNLSQMFKIWNNLEAGISIDGQDAKFFYMANSITLIGGAEDAAEVFGKEPYKHLNVKGKVVYDIGASVGDTALYFLLRGAKRVYGYEADEARYQTSLQNWRNLKQLEDFIPFNNRVEALGSITFEPNSVLKMDIEGGEYEIFRTANRGDLANIEEIILEFHKGDQPIKAWLEDYGYEVKITHRSLLNKDFGILYAVKTKR